tara:strand:- start:1919 stop:2149 length:231 start_codon:yes stop_codon:yes gene_type:complete
MADPMEMIIELAVREVLHVILASKCCHYSKQKWKKIISKVEETKEQRLERIREMVADLTDAEKHEIFGFAKRVSSV